MDFSEAERGQAARAIALAAAGSNHAARIALLDAVPPAAVDVDVQRYQLREGIARFGVKPIVLAPNHFLNQIVFSNSENSIAFQDKFHVFVWHTGDQNHSSSNHMKTRVDLFSTNGVSQWISLPSDTVVLMLPIFPHLSQTNNNDPTEMTREKLEEQLGLRPSAHRWRAYKAGGQNEWNPLIELANPTDKPAKHFTSILPADFPSTAQSAGNNTFFSFSNHSDGLDQFVLIKVWTKTIETTFSN
jgi:hypothetical protein